MRSLRALLPLSILALGLVPVGASAGTVTIKLGTLAPEGSPWHKRVLSLAERWKKASDGTVELKVYPGGVAGNEGDMVRKMRIGQLHAAAITGIGLGEIHRSTIALQIPMVMQSWEELDYVRDKIGPEIAGEMEKAGFVVLNWGDAGWVHFFSKSAAITSEDYRKLKLFVPAGDPAAEKAWRKASFNPVPLSTTDVLSALQTGMVDAFQTTALFALSSQWFGLSKQMVKVNWSPLNGAMVISKKQWDKIDPKYREALLKISREEGEALRNEVRAMSDKAVQAMVERGLKVVEPDAAATAGWQKTAELAYPEVRGPVVPEHYFDEVRRLVSEYRAKPRAAGP
ncbi:MAG: TRAP transporter substrate-binding protein DctP [Deltaproteobacteria bacterium]|nr:TRAP transporter substrate-binding protein DctP [Deltaproteobacteria bacterium]